mgnify:CR=1 FL=1
MYMKYLREKSQIPKENLVEVRYEDFIQDPLEQIQGIYSRLNLGEFHEFEKKFSDFIASQSLLKKQKYLLDQHLKDMIYAEWRFAFEAFHYEK